MDSAVHDGWYAGETRDGTTMAERMNDGKLEETANVGGRSGGVGLLDLREDYSTGTTV